MADPAKYPKCKYHDTLPSRLVVDEVEEKALGDGWWDHPTIRPVPPAPEVPKPVKVKPIRPDDSK